MKRLGIYLVMLAILLPSVSFAQTGPTPAAGSPGSLFKSADSRNGTLGATFIVPNGVSRLLLTGCGGGGGGAGGFAVAAQGAGGGGSGAGCYSNVPLYVTSGATLTTTVGSAGLGGAIGAVGGVANVNTTIAGLPIGTFTIPGGTTASTAGTATTGGNGGGTIFTAGGVGTTSTCGAGSSSQIRAIGGDVILHGTGGSGGGATGPSAGCVSVFIGYSTVNISGGVVAGGQAGGGAGGSSPFGVGGAGGTNVGGAGTVCTAGGYGAGGGGGASNAAGGNGCPGFIRLEWMQ